MVCRATLTSTRAIIAVISLKILFPIVAIVLFLISIPVNSTAESMQGMNDILSGTIASIDLSREPKSLTLRADNLGILAIGSSLNIFVNDKTTVLMCEAAKSLKDLTTGSRAVVMYHKAGRLTVADFIYKPC